MLSCCWIKLFILGPHFTRLISAYDTVVMLFSMKHFFTWFPWYHMHLLSFNLLVSPCFFSVSSLSPDHLDQSLNLFLFLWILTPVTNMSLNTIKIITVTKLISPGQTSSLNSRLLYPTSYLTEPIRCHVQTKLLIYSKCHPIKKFL